MGETRVDAADDGPGALASLLMRGRGGYDALAVGDRFLGHFDEIGADTFAPFLVNGAGSVDEYLTLFLDQFRHRDTLGPDIVEKCLIIAYQTLAGDFDAVSTGIDGCLTDDFLV